VLDVLSCYIHYEEEKEEEEEEEEEARESTAERTRPSEVQSRISKMSEKPCKVGRLGATSGSGHRGFKDNIIKIH
jgi:hypothetical protein